MAKYFGGSQAGAFGDARVLLELMQLNMAMVLNQPKSGLWNVLSLADFPIVFKGLGRSAGTAMFHSGKALANNVFGSALQAMGINILQAGEYHGEGRRHAQVERWVGSL
jgi:hypothetical protein